MNVQAKLCAWMFVGGREVPRVEVSADEEHVAREFVRSGNADAFRHLVEHFQDRVFHLAVSVLGSEFAAEAEEVAQDVFLEVYRHARRFRGESKFSTWLYRVALNRALDVRARGRYRRPHVAAEEALAGAASRDDPGLALRQQETRARLAQEIDGLPELQQTILRLHYWIEEPVGEIALRLDLPVNTVKSHLLRARRQLAARFGEERP